MLSADEAAVLGLSHDGEVIQRGYLRDPNGAAVYSLSMWPVTLD